MAEPQCRTEELLLTEPEIWGPTHSAALPILVVGEHPGMCLGRWRVQIELTRNRRQHVGITQISALLEQGVAQRKTHSQASGLIDIRGCCS